MWSTVQTQLEAALSSTYFPKLIDDQNYKYLFTAARLTPPSDRLDFTLEERARLAEQIKLKISMFIGDLQFRRAVNDSTLKFSLLKEVRIYRVVSASASTLSGMWWFSEDDWKGCVQATAGASDSK